LAERNKEHPVSAQPEITCVVPAQNKLGEGCLWDPDTQSIWWLDIARPSAIHCFNPETKEHKHWPSEVLLTAIARRTRGGFILGGEDGVYSFDPESGVITPFCKPETDLPGNRFNDGACDPAGHFWIGTMQHNIGPKGEELGMTADTGRLYCVAPDGTSSAWARNVGVSNGPCWSPDGKTFYFSDSRNQVISAYDFDVTDSTLSNQRLFNKSKSYGYPDGATIDAEGYLWSARWDGACILRFDPKGRIDRIIETPVTRPTCVVFGGPDLDTLYFTSSRAHCDIDVLTRYPNQGGLFSCQPGVKGTLKHSFWG
jgi:L-arabinonolactonase